MTYVGLRPRVPGWMPSTIPAASVVLPAPSSPMSAIQSPALRSGPRFRPNALVSPGPLRSERISTSTVSALWRQGGHGQNHLLKGDPAVLEAAAVLVFVLVELRRIDEVEILFRDDVLLVQGVAREAEPGRVFEVDRLLGIALQIRPELESEVRRCLAVSVHQRRPAAQPGAVVGSK